MSGHMARGMDMKSAAQSAAKSSEACLVAVNNLYDANQQDFSPILAEARLVGATELFVAGVAGLVANGKSPDDALMAASRAREPMLRAANGIALAATAASEHVASEGANERIQSAARNMAGIMSGQMARGMALDSAIQDAAKYRDGCLLGATSLQEVSEGNFSPALAKERLLEASQHFSTAVAGLVGRGESPAEALAKTSRNRDFILGDANDRVCHATAAANPELPRELNLATLAARRAADGRGGAPTRRSTYGVSGPG